jgi:hypothetical protein
LPRARPDRKGKVESGVGHAKKTRLKGLRFESLEEAQAYLDRREERWADTRIHGTTKREFAAMSAEERPALLPFPLEFSTILTGSLNSAQIGSAGFQTGSSLDPRNR